MASWTVRRLSNYTETVVSNSDSLDIGDSAEVHAVFKVSAIGGTDPTLVVRGQHSIDGLHWENLAGLVFVAESTQKIQTKTATTAAFRYLRFSYNLVGTNPTVTFEIKAIVKAMASRGVPP